ERRVAGSARRTLRRARGGGADLAQRAGQADVVLPELADEPAVAGVGGHPARAARDGQPEADALPRAEDDGAQSGAAERLKGNVDGAEVAARLGRIREEDRREVQAPASALQDVPLEAMQPRRLDFARC